VGRSVHLERDGQRVVVKGDVEIRNDVVYALFDRTPAERYDEVFEQALVLGCYALGLNSTGELLSKVATDLNADLQHLRMLIELRGLKERSAAVAGGQAEADIIDRLQAHADAQGWGDAVASAGQGVGVLPRRKVGDAVISVAGTQRRIVVESKADRSVSLGGPATVDPLKTRADIEKKTAYGQGLTALANREAEVAILVHFDDNAHRSIRQGGIIQFLPEQPAFVVIVDRVSGQWDALFAAYGLARGLCLAWEAGAQRWEAVDLLVKRVDRELARLNDIDGQLRRIGQAAEGILESLQSIQSTREAIRSSLDLMAESKEALRVDPANALAKRRLYLDLGKEPG